jgi:Acyclic terpene utilisation family protein AtuA
MLYENADPFRLLEPSGALDTSAATYTALDERSVRVEGSRFEQAPSRTAKLEGARLAGYETISLVGIRDPRILDSLDVWLGYLRSVLTDRVRSTLDLEPRHYDLALRCYGADAVLGPLEDSTGPAREIGLLLKVRASSQQTATAIAKTANPLLLHLPLPGMNHLPSFAFATSPAEIERGPSYEFALNHVLELEHGTDLFRLRLSEVTGA